MNLNRLFATQNQRNLQRKNLRNDRMVEVTCHKCGRVLAQYPASKAGKYSNQSFHCRCPSVQDRVSELSAGANLGVDI